MKKKIFFRVDGGGSVGFGHLIRLISIQKELLRQYPEMDVKFVSKESQVLLEKLSENNISHILIPPNVNESAFILRLCAAEKPDLLFIDVPYSYLPDDLARFKKFTKIFLFNNISAAIFEATIAIIPSAHRDLESLQSYSHLNYFFSGMKYVVLNENVFNIGEIGEVKPKTIGITTGGSDPNNVLIKIINILTSGSLKDFNIKAFYGENFQRKDQLLNFDGVKNLEILPYNLNELAKNEIVISTFGVTTYELLFLGKSILSLGHANNNAKGSRNLELSCNCLVDLGHVNNLLPEKLISSIQEISQNHQKRNELEKLGPKLIDGKGVKRIVKKIMEVI